MIEIRSKGGKIIGRLSDSMDGEDYLVIKNKKVPLSDVYADKELKDSFNEDIKQSSKSTEDTLNE